MLVIEGSCANCRSPLHGEFCHACGQRRLGERPLSAMPFVRQFAVELIHFDFKSLRSLLALFRPGHLAAEFIGGRRITYLGPLKLYFLTAALFFLAAQMLGTFNLHQLLAQDDGALQAAIDARVAETHMPLDQFEERFNLRFNTVYTFSPIFSAIAVALVLRLLYRRTVSGIGAHVVFALYYVAFFYVAALAANALYSALGHRQPLIFALLLYAVVTPYAFYALARVYPAPARTTLWKTFALLASTFVLDIPVNVAARAVTIALT